MMWTSELRLPVTVQWCLVPIQFLGPTSKTAVVSALLSESLWWLHIEFVLKGASVIESYIQ